MLEPHAPSPTPTPEDRAAYRVSRYRRPAIWRATDWRCQCAPGARRPPHREPFQCVPDDVVLAHWLAHPETTLRVVRMTAWLSREFGR